MRNLKDILHQIDFQLISGSLDQEINALQFDSRTVQKNDLFFDYYRIDWTTPQDQYDNFINYAPHTVIPVEILNRILRASVRPCHEHSQLRALLEDSLAQPISLEEIQAAIKTAPAGSIPDYLMR